MTHPALLILQCPQRAQAGASSSAALNFSLSCPTGCAADLLRLQVRQRPQVLLGRVLVGAAMLVQLARSYQLLLHLGHGTQAPPAQLKALGQSKPFALVIQLCRQLCNLLLAWHPGTVQLNVHTLQPSETEQLLCSTARRANTAAQITSSAQQTQVSNCKAGLSCAA